MIEIIRTKISRDYLQRFLNNPFPDMVKFVVDVRRGVLVLGGELHADAEAVLLEQGSDQADLWGGNIFPDKKGDQRIVYTAMINIRPSAGNHSMEVKDKRIREKMGRVLDGLLG